MLSGVGFAWLFSVQAAASPTLTAVYVACIYLLLSTGLSLFGVPYLAMASELTSDPAERTRVLSFRQIALLLGVFVGLPFVIGGVVAMGGAVVAQSIGHKREAVPPLPFRGPSDALVRILAEQVVTFPRFVTTGGFDRAWAAARRALRR